MAPSLLDTSQLAICSVNEHCRIRFSNEVRRFRFLHTISMRRGISLAHSHRNQGLVNFQALWASRRRQSICSEAITQIRLDPVMLFANPQKRKNTRTYQSGPIICQALSRDPGDWAYSPQWWGTQGGGWGYDQGEEVCCLESSMGNGLMKVTAHPAMLRTDLRGAIYENFGISKDDRLEWRVLRFNDITRQSVCLGVRTNEGFIALPFLCFEYLKSMVSTALAAFACHGRRSPVFTEELSGNAFSDLNILCVGMGGGTLPLFLAHHFPSCTQKVIEIDPKVAFLAERYMGFPAEYGSNKGSPSRRMRDLIDRIDVVIGDACDVFAGSSSGSPFDIIFIDAFGGDDEIPMGLTTQGRGFLEAIKTETSASTLLITNSHGGLPPPGIMERITKKFGPGYDVQTDTGRKILDYARSISNALGEVGQKTSYTVSVQSQDNVIIVNQGYESKIDEKMLSSIGNRLEKSDLIIPFGVQQRCIRGFSKIPS